MIKSEYINKFKEAAPYFQLTGNKLLIERIEVGEIKTKSGLIIGATDQVRADLRIQKPHVGIVVAVGEGYYDSETNTTIPCDIKVGNVVQLNSLGVQYLSVLPGIAGYAGQKIGITTEADVQSKFASIEDYQKYTEIFNA